MAKTKRTRKTATTKAAVVNPSDVAAFAADIAATIVKYNNRLYRLKRAEDINLVVQMVVPIVMAILAMRSAKA